MCSMHSPYNIYAFAIAMILCNESFVVHLQHTPILSEAMFTFTAPWSHSNCDLRESVPSRFNAKLSWNAQKMPHKDLYTVTFEGKTLPQQLFLGQFPQDNGTTWFTFMLHCALSALECTCVRYLCLLWNKLVIV